METAVGGISFQWKPGTLQKMLSRMKLFAGAVKSAPELCLQAWAPILEQHMKANAHWQDRTGDARRGLTADVFKEDDIITLALYHTVTYGIWLEIRWQGRYAIIGPTLMQFQEQIMADLPRFVGISLPAL